MKAKMLLRAAILMAFLLIWLPIHVGAETLRVAVISDLNGSYGSSDYDSRVPAAVEQIISMQPDLVISTGDMVAGQQIDPKLTKDNLIEMWRAFDEVVTDPLVRAQLPFAVTPGNHDASAYESFALERQVYAEQWKDRPNLTMVDHGTYPFAYAFSLDDVLFISLDITMVGALSDEQMSWLENLLARTQGSYRAQVVFSHLPLWPFAVGRETEVVGDPALAELFEKYEIDLHLSGHHHAYFPGASGGVLYVSQACLGSGPRPLIGGTERSQHSFTMIEIGDDGIIDVYALIGPDYITRVNHQALPAKIGSGRATLWRMDLAAPK